MASIIVATPKSSDANRIADTLRKHGMEQVSAVCLGADVLSQANNADYGIVICTKRLNDLSYRELVGYSHPPPRYSGESLHVPFRPFSRARKSFNPYRALASLRQALGLSHTDPRPCPYRAHHLFAAFLEIVAVFIGDRGGKLCFNGGN